MFAASAMTHRDSLLEVVFPRSPPLGLHVEAEDHFDTDTIEESLERGEEIVIYDEADVRAGPLDVTVIRNSDGAEVATTSIIDGTTYDVDGNESLGMKEAEHMLDDLDDGDLENPTHNVNNL